MQIIIMRHAEKPETGTELSQAGHERSLLLPAFFESNEILKEFGKPVAIYAAAPRTEKHSIRSIQTVMPLATNLNLQINQQYTKNDLVGLVDDIMKHSDWPNQSIVICWNRAGIPILARLFGILESSSIWPANVYDRVWVIRSEQGKAVSFLDIPQKLMATDSQT